MSKVQEFNTQSGNVAAALALTGVDLRSSNKCGVVVSTTVATQAVKTFASGDVSLSEDTITIASHGYATGLKVAATTGGTLPTGLTATDYWAIKVDANTIKLASSAANALASTAVDITGSGAGTHTLTPAAITSASYKLQMSYDNVNYFDIASATNNVTVTADFVHEFATPTYNYIRLLWAITTGQIAYNVYTNVKAD